VYMDRETLNLPLDRVIAFHPILAKVLGGIEEAIYFQQLYFWSDKGKRTDGYIYKTKEEIYEETTITWRQQDRIRQNLVKKGYLKTKLIKANGSPTIHYKINVKMVQKAIDSNNFPNITKRNNGMLQNVTFQYNKTLHSITENTTEITSEMTKNNDNDDGHTSLSATVGEVSEYQGKRDIDPYIEKAIAYYYSEYYYNNGEEHPKLKADQVFDVERKLAEFCSEYSIYAFDDPYAILKSMIDTWFNSNIDTDWNINHFVSAGILVNRYYEVVK